MPVLKFVALCIHSDEASQPRSLPHPLPRPPLSLSLTLSLLAPPRLFARRTRSPPCSARQPCLFIRERA